MQNTGSNITQQCADMFGAFHQLTAADVPLADLGVSVFQKGDVVGFGERCVLELYQLSSRVRLAMVTDRDLPKLPNFLEGLREALLKLKIGELSFDHTVVGRQGVALVA